MLPDVLEMKGAAGLFAAVPQLSKVFITECADCRRVESRPAGLPLLNPHLFHLFRKRRKGVRILCLDVAVRPTLTPQSLPSLAALQFSSCLGTSVRTGRRAFLSKHKRWWWRAARMAARVRRYRLRLRLRRPQAIHCGLVRGV